MRKKKLKIVEIERFKTKDGEVLPAPNGFAKSWNYWYIEKYYSKKAHKESLKGFE